MKNVLHGSVISDAIGVGAKEEDCKEENQYVGGQCGQLLKGIEFSKPNGKN
jgi:hypothetical protein